MHNFHAGGDKNLKIKFMQLYCNTKLTVPTVARKLDNLFCIHPKQTHSRRNKFEECQNKRTTLQRVS